MKMLRKLALGSGVVALIPSINAASPVPESPGEPLKPSPMRLSDLPIYEAPHAEYGEYVSCIQIFFISCGDSLTFSVFGILILFSSIIFSYKRTNRRHKICNV